MNNELNNSRTFIRFVGSTSSKFYINFLISLEKHAGTGLYCPLTIFKAKACKFVASNGGFNAQSSYKITPKDHKSASNEYGLF